MLYFILTKKKIKDRFRLPSTRVPNLTGELSTAKERRLNQFGTAVSTVCRTFVELNLGSTHGARSESDVAPVSLQSRTYSIRFGTSRKSTILALVGAVLLIVKILANS